MSNCASAYNRCTYNSVPGTRRSNITWPKGRGLNCFTSLISKWSVENDIFPPEGGIFLSLWLLIERKRLPAEGKYENFLLKKKIIFVISGLSFYLSFQICICLVNILYNSKNKINKCFISYINQFELLFVPRNDSWRHGLIKTIHH